MGRGRGTRLNADYSGTVVPRAQDGPAGNEIIRSPRIDVSWQDSDIGPARVAQLDRFVKAAIVGLDQSPQIGAGVHFGTHHLLAPYERQSGLDSAPLEGPVGLAPLAGGRPRACQRPEIDRDQAAPDLKPARGGYLPRFRCLAACRGEQSGCLSLQSGVTNQQHRERSWNDGPKAWLKRSRWRGTRADRSHGIFAVGNRVAPVAPHGSGRAPSGIRLQPRVSSGNPLSRPRVADPDRRP